MIMYVEQDRMCLHHDDKQTFENINKRSKTEKKLEMKNSRGKKYSPAWQHFL